MITGLLERAQWYFQTHARGHEHARSIKEIETALDLDNRSARDIIHNLRTVAGLAIISLSSEGGYFLLNPESSKDVEKADHFVKEQMHRKSEIDSIISPVRNVLNNLDVPLLL